MSRSARSPLPLEVHPVTGRRLEAGELGEQRVSILALSGTMIAW
jgi:hypothetical protein